MGKNAMAMSTSQYEECYLTQSHPSGEQSYATHSQDAIYQFLLQVIRQHPPEQVLLEFKRLWLSFEATTENCQAVEAVSQLLGTGQKQMFLEVLKRSCYILINNWNITNQQQAIAAFIDLFEQLETKKRSGLLSLNHLRKRLRDFLNSRDYQELKVFAAASGQSGPQTSHWSDRYTSYRLLSQSQNVANSTEQREAARRLSQKLDYQFKFDLARYAARLHSPIRQPNQEQNPTALDDDFLRLVTIAIAKQSFFSYKNLANIFLQQTRGLNYSDFKSCLQRYLIFSPQQQALVRQLDRKLAEKLAQISPQNHQHPWDKKLLSLTCKRAIDALTMEAENPAELFILLLSQGHSLTLVTLLLKLALIAPDCRRYLESRLTQLVDYYRDYPEEDCQWVLQFFEVFRIAFAIHADNVQYDLVRVNAAGRQSHSAADLSAYRIFSQFRGEFVTPFA